MDIKLVVHDPRYDIQLEPEGALGVNSTSSSSVNMSNVSTTTSHSSQSSSLIVDTVSHEKIKTPTGRRPLKLWKEFDVSILESNKKLAICRHCKSKISEGAKAYRLRKHLVKCSDFLKNCSDVAWILSAPASTSTIKSKPGTSQQIQRTSKSNNEGETNRTHEENQQESKLLLSSENDNVEKVSELEIDKQLVRFIFANKIQAKILENCEFQKLVQLLNPCYRLPLLNTVMRELIPVVHKEMRSESENSMTAKDVVLCQNGWSRPGYGHYLISHVLCNTNKFSLLNMAEVSSGGDNTFLCASLLKDAISFAEKRFHCKVVGVVIDNINQFLETKEVIRSFNGNIHIQASLRHLFVCLGQSFVNLDAMDKIQKIFKYFRNHDYECNKINEDLTNDPETRWNNNYNAMTSFIKDREKYIEVLTDSNYQTSSEVYNVDPVIQIPMKGNAVDEAVFLEILNNTAFNEVVHNMNLLLQSFQETFNMIQDDTCTLADGAAIWLHWTKNNVFTDGERQRIDECQRIGLTPEAIVAYAVHPKYKGLLLTEEELETGRQFLLSTNFEYLDPFIAFLQSDDRIYPKSLINQDVCKCMDAIRWWREQLRNSKLPHGFVAFVISLLLMPANAVSTVQCI